MIKRWVREEESLWAIVFHLVISHTHVSAPETGLTTGHLWWLPAHPRSNYGRCRPAIICPPGGLCNRKWRSAAVSVVHPGARSRGIKGPVLRVDTGCGGEGCRTSGGSLAALLLWSVQWSRPPPVVLFFDSLEPMEVGLLIFISIKNEIIEYVMTVCF